MAQGKPAKPSNGIWFYNTDNGRPDDQVNKEIRAISNPDAPDRYHRPAVIGLCETTGLHLNKLDGYHLVRDTSTSSRANVAAYCRGDLWGGHVTWVDLHFTWPRTQAKGTHEPRSYLIFRCGQIQVVVYHAPPKNAKDCHDGQAEGIDSITAKMTPNPDAKDPDFQTHRPRVAIADWNRRKNEDGPGPSSLAHRIGGSVHGGKIDALVKRGHGNITKVAYPTSVGGVKLKSDHGHALHTVLQCDDHWWEPS